MANYENMSKPVEINQSQKLRTFFPRPFYPYPAEYDARIHGPYDPARTYGPPKVAVFCRDNTRCAKTPLIGVMQYIYIWMALAVVYKSGYLPFSYGGYKTQKTHKYHW